MSGSEENQPVPPDETEVVEEGDASANVPIKGDATEVVPLSIPSEDGKRLNLSEGNRTKK
ncbi:MAG TPA: hypothetical protein VI039_07045 [Solirubrobacterales bacterium]